VTRRTRRRPGALAATLAGIVLLAGAGCASGADAQGTAPRSRPARHLTVEYTDRTRPAVDPVGERSAPVRRLRTEVYLPAGGPRAPLVVFAHGYDGDPTKFSGLFRAWSRAGLAVLAPQFPVTHTGAARGPITRAGDIAEQPRDVSFVLDRFLAGPHAARVDRERIGVAGLSLGGGTTWALVADECCTDRRFRAAVVMDGNRFGFAGDEGERNRIPLLVLHATDDYALDFDSARESYDRAAAPKYFVTIHEFVHAEPYENTPDPADAMVERATIAFWRGYLLDDDRARDRIVTEATEPGVSDAEVVLR
jgi:dienelactone hydrolase